MKHPCTPDCPKRTGGCAINCPEWADYLVERAKVYAQKDEIVKLRDYQSVKRTNSLHRKFKQRRL